MTCLSFPCTIISVAANMIPLPTYSYTVIESLEKMSHADTSYLPFKISKCGQPTKAWGDEKMCVTERNTASSVGLQNYNML